MNLAQGDRLIEAKRARQTLIGCVDWFQIRRTQRKNNSYWFTGGQLVRAILVR